MAANYYTHGEDGCVLRASCVNRDGTIPAFDTGTLRLTAFFPGEPTQKVLDVTTVTSPTPGILQYVFTTADQATIPNRTATYSVLWWWNRGGLSTAYPEGGYDTLQVTASPV